MRIFSIDARKLTSYAPNEGIDLIKRLLWAEAWRVGIPRHYVNISGDITVADGGIDAAVSTNGKHNSILVAGKTYYQVKTGASFKPWQKAQIKAELFGDQPVGLAALGAQTRKGLEQGVDYSLVVLGHDLTTEQSDQAKHWLVEYFGACGFSNIPIHILGAGEIAGVLGLHPSLCLEINGLGDVRFQAVGSWKANADMTPSLSLGALQGQFVDQLREVLEDPAIQHVRVVGEPGIGKTRLVLEAIYGKENLSASTMYFRQASDFQGTVFFNELMREGEERSAILVIDECENRERTDIWAALKGRLAIKLVTIDHGPDPASGTGMQTLQVPLLEREQIENILRSYLPGNQPLHNWAMWCEGSARVAHALGENLRDHPEDILRSPDTVQIWDRFISGYGSDVEGGRARTLLMHIALFEMFGYLPPVQEEADFVSALVQKADPSITRQKFDQIVHYYLQRRILQGDRTLRIVPKALRVYLWREWWQNFGASANIRELLDTMPESLHRWFMHSFVYAQDVRHALSVVRALLDPDNGLFIDKAMIMSDVGAGFIFVLAQAAPAETLILLRGILQWTDGDLKALRKERHTLARALAIIAVWQPHFRTAARVLAGLSFGESSTYSNNCRGTLKALFVPFNAPTQTPFAERAALALELLASHSDFVRELGLDLSASCLTARSVSRVIGVEFQGAQPEINFWRAKLWTDWTEPWASVVEGLMNARTASDEAWTGKIEKIVLAGVGELLKTNVLHDLCLQSVTKLAKVQRNFEQIYQLLSNIERYPPKELPAEVLDAITKLRGELDGSDFYTKLQRHVLSAIWDDEIYGLGGDGQEKSTNRIRLLAEEAASNLALLRTALPQLFSNGVERRADKFGEYLAIALIDDRFDHEMLSYAIEGQENTRHAFMEGYLRGVFSFDATRWEALSLALLATPVRWAVLSVVDSGATPEVFERLLEIHRDSTEDTAWIWLLCRDPIPALLGQERIRRAIQAVLDKNCAGYETAIHMAEWALCKKGDELDLPLTMEVLVAGANHDATVMADHYWGELAGRFVEQAPQQKVELFRLLVEGTCSFGGFTSGGRMSKVAFEICKEAPVETWAIVAKALQSDRAYVFKAWLGRDESRGEPQLPAITAFNQSDIFAWIDEDKSKRAHQILEALPKTLEAASGGNLTKDFLMRYLGIDGIGRSLIFFFGAGSYSGPRSEHLSARRSKAQRWMAQVGQSLVGDWLGEYVHQLSKEIEAEKIREERSLW